MPSLQIDIPGQTPAVYQLYKTLTSIGSSPDCDVILPDPLVDANFAYIRFDGQIYTITTESRKNEISVNGKNRKKHKLCHRDKLIIGDIQLRFALVDECTVVAPEAASDIASYQKIQQFSARLMQKHDLSELLNELMDTIIEITNAEKGFLVLTEGESHTVKVARNVKKQNIADTISQLSDSIVAKVVHSKKPLMISDATNDENFSNSKSILRLQLTSVICVPLLERGRLLGIIYVGNDSVAALFSEETLRAVTVFAAQASLIVSNALLLNTLKLDNRVLNERLASLRFGEIIGTSKAMTEVFRKVEKVAPTDVSVLITGETGTGKELIANEIHKRSPRAHQPFIVINSGAIPENLLESELFGHVKGAFTGAISNKIGKFQAANKGTLFLDEIGEMALPLQSKLLRAIQEKVVVRVGDTRPESVDIRILAATNCNLEQAIADGRFREDLFYRLNVVNLTLPALRERGDDLLMIARFLLSRYIKEYDTKVQGLSPNATAAIRKHTWPGNIRELENRLKKAIILSDGSLIGSEDLGLGGGGSVPKFLPLNQAKDKFQRDYINEVLAVNHGNRAKTARDLGVDPRTIFRHLEKEDKCDKKYKE